MFNASPSRIIEFVQIDGSWNESKIDLQTSNCKSGEPISKRRASTEATSRKSRQRVTHQISLHRQQTQADGPSNPSLGQSREAAWLRRSTAVCISSSSTKFAALAALRNPGSASSRLLPRRNGSFYFGHVLISNQIGFQKESTAHVWKEQQIRRIDDTHTMYSTNGDQRAN
jgi:hypothetical protein